MNGAACPSTSGVWSMNAQERELCNEEREPCKTSVRVIPNQKRQKQNKTNKQSNRRRIGSFRDAFCLKNNSHDRQNKSEINFFQGSIKKCLDFFIAEITIRLFQNKLSTRGKKNVKINKGLGIVFSVFEQQHSLQSTDTDCLSRFTDKNITYKSSTHPLESTRALKALA